MVEDSGRSKNNLIIFDCDGVLVDSEPLAAQIFSEQLAKNNIFLDALSCRQKYKGLTLKDCIASINCEFKTELTQDFLDELKWATEKGFARALKPVSGIDSVLRKLSSDQIMICVASNGEHKKIRHSLAITNLEQYFDKIFSTEDVAQGKPAPDLFLFAAYSCGVEAKNCVVIEDSFTGLMAAKAAGMQVLFFSEEEIADAGFRDIVRFSQMEQLPSLLEAIWLR